MRAALRKNVDRVRSSYWFIPLLMALASIGLAIGMVALDQRFKTELIRQIPWLYVNQPAGARALLQTIAGSMITVAGVTFSITIATVANAASQFGPRLMTNFMNDRGNQITLGTFIATFLYSVLVLRTVRGADTGMVEEIFVPNLAVFVSMALALASLAVLIYFIHHIPESIHISNMIARAGQQLHHRIAALYPESIGRHGDGGGDAEITATEEDEAETATTRLFEGAAPVPAAAAGYVQHVEAGSLIRAAADGDLLICIVGRPGAFVGADAPLALVTPADLVTDRTIKRIRAAFVVGPLRTPVQDVIFMVDQLVEVAAKALSPGINDPLTAFYAMDWLRDGMILLARRRTPSAHRFDDAGHLRVIAPPVTFEQVVDVVFGRLRPYVQADRNAALHMAEVMDRLARSLTVPRQHQALRRQIEAFARGCEQSLSDDEDRATVGERCRQVLHRLATAPDPTRKG